MLKKNQVCRAVIEGYSSEGLGIARIEGQVVFVHRAVRGEECDVLILKVLKNAAFGKVTAIHTPSPHRQEPDCPYYGKCGGCDCRHMSYEEELRFKLAKVNDALARIGRQRVQAAEIVGSERIDAYRNKGILAVGKLDGKAVSPEVMGQTITPATARTPPTLPSTPVEIS
mgnify:CR=1 FL=1